MLGCENGRGHEVRMGQTVMVKGRMCGYGREYDLCCVGGKSEMRR